MPFDYISPKAVSFGPGKIQTLPKRVEKFGNRVLLVTGNTSFLSSETWQSLDSAFRRLGLTIYHATIPGEPSPEDVDQITERFRGMPIDVVVAAGGGSALDAGKAISAMLPHTGSVVDFLEGIGSRRHSGIKVPFVAVPTTAGTGSEATFNAVISRTGPDGFKKSLRHHNFAPDIALVDPALTLSCPPAVTAACGMDALTQLIESYVSVQASPMSDAICRSGLEGFGQALLTAAVSEPENLQARSRLSWGACASGLALANAGLGTVHGFASMIGAISPMGHGNVCGALLAETTRAAVDWLFAEQNTAGLSKYADAARIMGIADTGLSDMDACGGLVESLYRWTSAVKLPGLGEFGITRSQIPAVARATGNKNAPARLSQKALEKILAACL